MPIKNFTVPEGNCQANQKTTSASTVIDNNPSSVMIRLTSTEWTAKTGTGDVRWGLELSPDGSAWDEWLWQPSAIGDLGGKDGLLPALQVTGGSMSEFVGYRVRLFAVPTVAIRLGAQVRVIA